MSDYNLPPQPPQPAEPNPLERQGIAIAKLGLLTGVAGTEAINLFVEGNNSLGTLCAGIGALAFYRTAGAIRKLGK